MTGCDRAFSKAMQLVCSAVENRLAAATYEGTTARALASLADRRSEQAMNLVEGLAPLLTIRAETRAS